MTSLLRHSHLFPDLDPVLKNPGSATAYSNELKFIEMISNNIECYLVELDTPTLSIDVTQPLVYDQRETFWRNAFRD